MEKDKKVKVILFAGLILFAVLAMLWEDPVSFEGQEEQYSIKKSEPKEEKEETFYRYNLSDGSSIIVKEYPYSDYWDSTKERIGKQMYLWFPQMKHFKNAETNMTQIKEHLKNLNKDL